MTVALPVDARPAVTIHSLHHAQAALRVAQETSSSITLLSPEGAANTLGIGWFQAIRRTGRDKFPTVDAAWILDCGSAAGRAATALGSGFDAVIFTGDAIARPALQSLADNAATILLDTRPDSLDLGTQDRGAAFKRVSPKAGDGFEKNDRMLAALAEWFLKPRR